MNHLQTAQARPYAKAAYAQAKANDNFADWLKLLVLASVVAQEPEVIVLCKDPRVPREQLLAFFSDLCEDVLFESGKNLIELLIKRKRILFLPKIKDVFMLLYREDHHFFDVELTTAVLLTPEQVKKFEERLSQRFAAKINLRNLVDPSIIGGALIRVCDNNQVIDCSVTGRLKRLTEALIA